MVHSSGAGMARAYGPTRVGTRRIRIFIALALALVLSMSALAIALAEPVLAPFPNAVNVIPKATPKVGSCIPFGNNTDWGFSGFIYRNVPPFTMRPGTKFAFDLGGINDTDVRRNIYFAPADHNPAPGNGNVRALSWTKVASESQIPSTPRGNSIVGDYDLVYTSEANFTFGGGGFIIGFGAASAFTDRGCEQVLVHTTINDPSGNFYARFWSKPDRDMGLLDRVSWGTTLIGGFVVFGDTTPPVVSATVDPAPQADGWVYPSGPTTVTFSGVDEASGIASCSDPVVLSGPGVHEVTGGCTDGAGNGATTSVTVRVARSVTVDLMGRNPAEPHNPHRSGPSTFDVPSGPSFDATTIDPASATFGATGDEPSVHDCMPFKGDLSCTYDVQTAGDSEQLHFKAFADGIRVFGSDAGRVVGRQP